jgi:cytochrome c oxidase assembly protein subunit 16
MKINPSLKTFLPFAAVTFGCVLFINEYRKIQYKFNKSNSKIVYKEDLKKLGVEPGSYQMLEAPSKQEQYERFAKNIDLDNWENKRVPRPWESNENQTNE